MNTGKKRMYGIVSTNDHAYYAESKKRAYPFGSKDVLRLQWLRPEFQSIIDKHGFVPVSIVEIVGKPFTETYHKRYNPPTQVEMIAVKLLDCGTKLFVKNDFWVTADNVKSLMPKQRQMNEVYVKSIKADS